MGNLKTDTCRSYDICCFVFIEIGNTEIGLRFPRLMGEQSTSRFIIEIEFLFPGRDILGHQTVAGIENFRFLLQADVNPSGLPPPFPECLLILEKPIVNLCLIGIQFGRTGTLVLRILSTGVEVFLNYIFSGGAPIAADNSCNLRKIFPLHVIELSDKMNLIHCKHSHSSLFCIVAVITKQG